MDDSLEQPATVQIARHFDVLHIIEYLFEVRTITPIPLHGVRVHASRRVSVLDGLEVADNAVENCRSPAPAPLGRYRTRRCSVGAHSVVSWFVSCSGRKPRSPVAGKKPAQRKRTQSDLTQKRKAQRRPGQNEHEKINNENMKNQEISTLYGKSHNRALRA